MNQNTKNYKGNGLNEQNNNNNNDIYDLGHLGAAPVALQGASSQGKWRGITKSGTGAPTMVDDIHDLSSVSGPQPMMAKQQQQRTVIHAQTMVMPSKMAFEDLGPAPLSFGSNNTALKPQLHVLPNIDDQLDLGQLDDFPEFKAEPSFFVASKCIGLNGGGLQATPAIYNEMTSAVVDESPKEVLAKFSRILDSFSNDIDYRIDEVNYMISGQIFIRHFAVYFKISIWTEQQQRTRFEIRRSKGDSFIFNEFWSDIEERIYKTFTNVEGNGAHETDEFGGGFPPIDYDLGGLHSMQQGLTPDDLDNFVSDIHEADPSVVYSIAMLLDAFKVQSQFVQMIFNHTQFIKCVIDSALTHKDTALVRGALITIERLCESRQAADSLIALNVLESVVPLLAAECDLIRKYTVRVLSKLSLAQSWKFNNNKLKKFAHISVKECQQKWEKCRFATNDFIEPKMFENIHSKLVGVN